MTVLPPDEQDSLDLPDDPLLEAELLIREPCSHCGGTGRRVDKTACGKCAGTGKVMKTMTVKQMTERVFRMLRDKS